MAHPGKFPLRLGIYGVVMAYLVGDLYLCDGPLSRRLKPADANGLAAAAAVDPVVARVGAYNIHRSQLERAVRERLWLEGRTLAGLAPPERRLIRQAALDDLIDHELLRTKARAHAAELQVADEEISERLSRFTAGFSNKQELADAMTAQGIASMQDLRDRLAARIQQEKYVEWRIAPLVKVTEAEARQWFEANQQHLATPGRVAARHVFLPTLERDADEAKRVLEAALADLTKETKGFATLARELSEDSLTKDGGGELGWMTRERLPAELADCLFSLPLNRPGLVRSKLGWHLIEVTARLSAEPRSYEQARPEIFSALEIVKRRQAAGECRAALRHFEANTIEIYPTRVEE